MLKRSAQHTAGILGIRAATAAAVTGASDGVHGADPIAVEAICQRLKAIFEVCNYLFGFIIIISIQKLT